MTTNLLISSEIMSETLGKQINYENCESENVLYRHHAYYENGHP